MGGHYYHSGDHERGMNLLNKGIDAMTRATSSPVPGFLRFCYFEVHYRDEKYEEALDEVSKMDMPKFWVTQAFMTAASAMLEADDETQIAKTRLLEIWPAFASKAKVALQNLVGDSVGDNDLVVKMLEGLKKSGLPE